MEQRNDNHRAGADLPARIAIDVHVLLGIRDDERLDVREAIAGRRAVGRDSQADVRFGRSGDRAVHEILAVGKLDDGRVGICQRQCLIDHRVQHVVEAEVAHRDRALRLHETVEHARALRLVLAHALASCARRTR